MSTFSEINIKGMVCNRCISTIYHALESEGYLLDRIALGKVKFKRPINLLQKDTIRDLLNNLGFELLSDKNEELLSGLKSSIEQWVESLESDRQNINLSEYLSQNFYKSYDVLSSFFSTCEGITIEQYFISLRINKVKKLLLSTSHSLSEITYKTGFNSVHHLSAQFKKYTGLSPSELRLIDKDFKKKDKNNKYVS